MSNQQHPTAEKSVQTHDSSGSSTLLMTNHPENTATEVANTLVSMATGPQRTITNMKQLNVMCVPNQSSSLPVLSLAEYTTSRGVPTAGALANQAKLTARKQEDLLQTGDENDMLVDEFPETSNPSNSTVKTRRTKTNKTLPTSKHHKQSPVEPIQYGPILVKPRKQVAPTLANGRRSKDDPLPPEQDFKRKQRRDRNKHAAAKCRKKRSELREELEQTERALCEQQQTLERSVLTLSEQKSHLEYLLHRHACARKSSLPIITTNTHHIAKTDLKAIPTTTTTTTLLDSANNPINSKRVTINFTNAQDLLAVAPSTRVTSTTDGSSSGVPMITIHIPSEVAQVLLGSTSVDRARFIELLQHASTANSSSITIMNQPTLDTMPTNTSTNNNS